MGLLDIFSKKPETLNEANKVFAKRSTAPTSQKDLKRRYGEGVEDFSQLASNFGVYGINEISGFNSFYKKYLDYGFKNNAERLAEYRSIARYPEIAEVLEDIVYESTQKNESGDLIQLTITDSDLQSNENIVKNLYAEFDNLFYKRIDLPSKIDDLLYSYYIDGRVFFEIVVDEKKPKNGVLNIKKLPTETMDFSWNPVSSKFNFFVQYFKMQGRLPKTLEDGQKEKDLICFYPKQIGYIDYGKYGMGGKKDVIGYLENARQPYNQLKLLETSIVIYRLVRAPERLVFKIDTGNMPVSKAIKFTEQMKQRLQKKITYDPSSGKLSNTPNVMAMLENFFLPSSCLTLDTEIALLDGRKVQLKELISEYERGITNHVFSVERKTGSIKIGEIQWAGITKRNQKIVRIWVNESTYVDSTYDHKFILANGEYCEAEKLQVGNRLMGMNYDRTVYKVEFLTERQDVGCLTIKDPGNNHNFMLGCNIFVKNSDGRGSSIESIGGNASRIFRITRFILFSKKALSRTKISSF